MNKQWLIWFGVLGLVGSFCALGYQASGATVLEHHNEHDEHDEQGHDDHDDHGEHGEHELLVLDSRQLASLKLGSYEVRRGTLEDLKEFPVEIHFDPNRVAHLTPRVPGIVTQVNFGLGDRVKRGDILAILESQELGMMKSQYLAAQSRLALRAKTHAREKVLWEKQISAEQDYLLAEKELQEAQIETKMARESLLALGVPEAVIEGLKESRNSFSRYEMAAPFDGLITEQHITRGERLDHSSKAFVIVDPGKVWAMARVFESDIRAIELGQKAMITIQAFPGETFAGPIDYVGSQLDPETRTVVARVVLANPATKLRAGMFGQLSVLVERSLEGRDTFLLPRAALQRSKDGFLVFREMGVGQFQPVAVQVIAQGREFTEVAGTLALGEKVATGDIFILKSQAEKFEAGDGHSH